MTITTGTLKSDFWSGSGQRHAVVQVRIGRETKLVTAQVPDGAPDRLPATLTLNHGHGDVYTVILREEPAEAPQDAQDAQEAPGVVCWTTEVARAFARSCVEEFGPCEIRQYQTDDDGSQWIVASNVKSEAARIRERGRIPA